MAADSGVEAGVAVEEEEGEYQKILKYASEIKKKKQYFPKIKILCFPISIDSGVAAIQGEAVDSGVVEGVVEAVVSFDLQTMNAFFLSP